MQVDVDRRRGLRHRQQVLALALAVLDLLERRRRRAAPTGCGWVGVHSTNFSPISDCGRIVHVASWRKSWNPGSVMSSVIAAFLSGVTSSDADLADLDAGDLHVLAGDDRHGVVEDRPDLVGAAVVARARAEDRHDGGGGEHGGDDGDALHGPGRHAGWGRSRACRCCRGTARSRRRGLARRARAAARRGEEVVRDAAGQPLRRVLRA